MRSVFSIVLICFFTNLIFGQEDFVLPDSYPEISLLEFIENVENNSDFHFYFNEEWGDTLLLKDIKAGTLLQEILGKELVKHGLHFYFRTYQVFIYQGSEIITELPEFDNIQTVEKKFSNSDNPDQPVQNEYIPTKETLKEQTIQIGNGQNIAGNRKCLVRGSIINRRDNEPLVGATIYVKELDFGTISDTSGRFVLNVLPGEYSVSVNHMAMKETHYLFRIYSAGEISLELENEIIELQEVTISTDRFDNVKSLVMGFDRLSTKSMKEIPVVLGEKDILKVAQMLPGVQNVGEGSSGFNVRGGSTDQNLFYINNISVYNTSHLFGFFTAFSPDIIKDFTLYKNNIPTKYGGRVASVFEITTRGGNKNKFFAHGGISPVTGHFSIEGPLIKEKVSIVASFRSTYSDWILKRMKDPVLKNSNASFYDGTIGINAEINENNQLQTFFYKSSDKFSLSAINDYSYSNSGASINWKHYFTRSLSADISFASSNYHFLNINKTNISEAYSQEYSIQHNELRTDFLLLQNENHRIEFGVNSILYFLDRGNILPYGEESTRTVIELGREHGIENAIYISDELKLFPTLDLLLGLRYSFYGQLGPAEITYYLENLPREINNISGHSSFGLAEPVKWYSGLEPRFALNYGLRSNTSIKASYNRLFQYIFLLSNTIAMAPTDQWKLVDYHLAPPVSDQVSLGYYKDMKNRGISVSIEIYNKWVNNIADYKNGANFISGVPIEQMVLQGSQKAYGIEFMLKRNSKKLTGWLSYCYSRSWIEINGIHAAERINNGVAYPSNYDRPHSLNLVSNFRVNRILSFSSNVVYSSGRPVTLPVSIYYAENQHLLFYSDRNQYRIPDYFRIDISVNLEGNLKSQKAAHSYWMLNVYNLTGRENAYSVYYKAEEGRIRGYKLSIFARPIITLSWHLKLGNYSND